MESKFAAAIGLPAYSYLRLAIVLAVLAMRTTAALAPLFVGFAALGTFSAAYTRPPAAPAAPIVRDGAPRVKLAVLVVFDQMRGDYPARWRTLYGPDGFVRLMTAGAWFTNCHYPSGTTSTGPGHASLLTGTCPDRHGIINNEWYEQGGAYCAGASRYAIVPAAPPSVDPKTGKSVKPPLGGTPERLLSETVADVLKKTHGPQAKVFGLSLKDRSAILPVGQRPDGAFWFDGRFVTSTYYTDRLDREVPLWIEAFNAPNTANDWFGRDWTRLRSDVNYDRHSGPDDAPGETGGTREGRSFPHGMTGGLKKPGKAYYEAFANSPYGNDLLLKLAKSCIVNEALGQDSVPDLLVVSFSSNDLIGHTWGPDSHEVLDATLRSDALMADFLRFLDEKVGTGNYVLALTADHGICPLVEASVAKGRPAHRIDPVELQAGAERYLRERFHDVPASSSDKDKTGWIEAFPFPWMYLNPRLVTASGRSREVVAGALARYLATVPHVHRAYAREDLAGAVPPRDDMHRRVKRSFHPDRSGDVYVVLNAFDLPSKPTATGTTHGSPHDYDTFVPLLVSGPGIRGGPRSEPVTPQATAAIFAKYLGLRLPADAEYPVPRSLE